jgi:hypothetical protein
LIFKFEAGRVMPSLTMTGSAGRLSVPQTVRD